MSFLDKAKATYGHRIRQTGLVMRRKQVRSIETFRRLARQYLRDTDKTNYVTPEAAASAGGDYLRRVLLGAAPLRPGVDYTPGASKVWSFGYVNHAIYRTHPNPLAIPESERLDMVVDWWSKDRGNAEIVANHLVFSFDPRLTALLGEQQHTKHLPLGDLLVEGVVNSLMEYQSRFYPRDQLGFLVGLHTDRAHAHAHVLVHPMTSHGRRVNLSTNQVREVDGRKVNVQYQAHLKESFSRYTKRLSDYALSKGGEAYTWIGREPDQRDVDLMREELVLAGRCAEEVIPPEGASGDEVLRARFLRRSQILALSNYQQLIARDRRYQRQEIEELISSGEIPDPPATNIDGAVALLEAAAVQSREAASHVSTVIGEMEAEPDRPGPVMIPDLTTPVSRSSVFRMLMESEDSTPPNPMTVSRFLRARTKRHAGWIGRLSEAVEAYAQTSRGWAQAEREQHVRLADSVSVLLQHSAEVTGVIPEFLREPRTGSAHLIPEDRAGLEVAGALRRISIEQAKLFEPAPLPTLDAEPRESFDEGPIDSPAEMAESVVTEGENAPIPTSAGNGVTVAPAVYGSSLSKSSDCVPLPPSHFLRRPAPSLDI